ncbi:MAG: hypothetical protein GY801_51125 [bacterium]|nr:hypothetical protein [bacterium]
MHLMTQHRAHARHVRKHQARQRQAYRRRKARQNRERQEKRNLMFRLHTTIDHHFPDLYEKIEAIPECRKQPQYTTLELILAGIAMFLFKKESRNAMNNERDEPQFRENYERLFKARLPHMDTVEDVMEVLDAEHIETLKTELVRGLLTKKILRKYRSLGLSYLVVIDGTHVMDVREGHCDQCLHQTFKNGKTRYFHNVLEAKLVGDNGFCLSLATEWVENSTEYDKQDCELKAFARLAETLKQRYPRLNICIVADGLYPNHTFFQICQEHGWSWIVTFKDGNLPSVWARVLHRQGLDHTRRREEQVRHRGKTIVRTYEWHPRMTYQGFSIHWFACEEVVDQTSTHFVYLGSQEMDGYSVFELTESGRLRWKIENEGFDIQKHHGYGLGHQFSRCSMLAMKNYDQLMQIAHLFNQLFELGSLLADVRRTKESLEHIGECITGEIRHEVLDIAVLATMLARRIRIRYD